MQNTESYSNHMSRHETANYGSIVKGSKYSWLQSDNREIKFSFQAVARINSAQATDSSF